MHPRRYETLVMLSPELSATDIDQIKIKFEGIITQMDGKIIRFEEWGRRRLAYLVKKQLFGYYLVYDFQGSPELSSEFERNLKLDEKVFKFLTLLLNKKFTDEDFENEKALQLEKIKKSQEFYKKESTETAISKDESTETATSKDESTETATSKDEATETAVSKDEASEAATSKDEATETAISKDEDSEAAISKDEATETAISKDEDSETTTSKDEDSNSKTDTAEDNDTDKSGSEFSTEKN